MLGKLLAVQMSLAPRLTMHFFGRMGRCKIWAPWTGTHVALPTLKT